MPSQQPQQASPAQQPQGMPPQNDPRMSAAMDVVESNIPEYLNPTDALMKRNQAAELAQQAMALMASADRQTAMSQQPPTPPTIAEQVDQRAMEGISGIAQRLSPGMQQRGQQVQQAQARKMLSGGMPSMGAPNMARMANGGIVGYQQGGKIDEELLAKLPKGDEVFRPSYPSRDDRIAEREREKAVRAANTANRDEEYNLRLQLADLDIDRAGQDAYIEAQKAKRKGALGDFSGLGSLRAPESFRMQGMEEVEKETPKGTQYDPTGKETEGLPYGRGEDTPAQDSINDIISKMADVEYREVPSSALRVPIEEAGLRNISRDPEAERRAEESRKQTQAEAVYAMSPEMKAAYAADRTKRDEYYTAQLDPKRQRDQKINALLAGLATPGGIAKSGIAALQGTTAVDDTALEMQRRRAEEDFASTKEQAGIEREGRVNAFDASTTAGQSAFERASAAVNQASQSLSQIASSEETREQAMAIQQYTIETGNLQLQLDELVRQKNLAEAEKTRMRYIVADLQDSQRNIDSNISNLQNSMLAMEEPEKVGARELIEAEKVRKAGMQRQIDETFRRIGFPTAGSPPSGSGADGASILNDARALMEQ